MIRVCMNATLVSLPRDVCDATARAGKYDIEHIKGIITIVLMPENDKYNVWNIRYSIMEIAVKAGITRFIGC